MMGNGGALCKAAAVFYDAPDRAACYNDRRKSREEDNMNALSVREEMQVNLEHYLYGVPKQEP